MFGWLRSVLSGKGVLVPGGGAIAEGEARGIDLGDPLAGGRRVILIKLDGELFALDARCPHNEGGQIQTGPLENGRLAVCPLHRYTFDPKTGKAEGVACAPARRYRVERRGDDAEIFA